MINKPLNFKTLAFCAILFAGIIFPTNLTAQRSDMFFKAENEDIYDNRATEGFTLGNDPFGEKPVPVGSGLLVLTVAGAGYAVARRKRSLRKGTTLLLALALILGMTQCKKRVETVVSAPDNMIHITLNVGNNSRHEIIPNEDGYVPVRYLVNDVVYVGNGTSYIGTLTCTVASDADGNNASFEGDIIAPNTDDVLHFYFVGGLTPSATLTAGTTTDFTVDISNQSSKLPVLSYTTATYNGSNSISCNLHNKCALVEFKLATGTNNTVKVSNMLCEAKIDFANPGITPTEKLDAISLYKSNTTGNTKRWAVLQLSNVERKSLGMVFRENSSDPSNPQALYNYYDGVDVPVLTETNNYLYGDNAIDINNNAATINNKVFVVSANGNAVRFATGNLVCTKTGTTWGDGYEWSFMSPQYNLIETTATEVGDDCILVDVIDHFGWGCTGTPDLVYGGNQNYYQPYHTSRTIETCTEYGPSNPHNLSLQNMSDWGTVVPNPEGYNWRLLTYDECDYLLNGRDNAYGKCGTVQIQSLLWNGAIFLPEEWNGTDINCYKSEWKNNNWTAAGLQERLDQGAIYLPASGYRYWYSNKMQVRSIKSNGYYWLSTNGSDDNGYYASRLNLSGSAGFKVDQLFPKYYGCAVRLVY